MLRLRSGVGYLLAVGYGVQSGDLECRFAGEASLLVVRLGSLHLIPRPDQSSELTESAFGVGVFSHDACFELSLDDVVAHICACITRVYGSKTARRV